MSANVWTHSSAARISQYRIDHVVVLRLLGALDGALADEVRELALEAHAPVVVDLDDCVLNDAASVQRLARGWELYRPEMCVVSGRGGDRQFLARAGVDQDLAIFERVEHAIEARAAGSRGVGWSPSRPV